MSQLRENLARARAQYATAKYPGSLAVDVLWNGNALRPAERFVLPPSPPRWRIILRWGLGLCAAAAVVCMFAWIERRPPPIMHPNWNRPQASIRSPLEMPERPPTPDHVRLVPHRRLAMHAPPPTARHLHKTISLPPRPDTPGPIRRTVE